MSDDAKKKPEEQPDIQAPLRPSEITAENIHLADFDHMEVRLLCLVSNKRNFDFVSGYLKRRGWQIFVTESVKELLTSIPSFEPDFILISLNVSHPKITSIPRIVCNTFKTPTVVFGEGMNAQVMQKMEEVTGVQKIRGFASGPMIQIRLKQTLQNMFGNEEEAEDKSNKESHSSSQFEELAKEEGAEAEEALRFAGRVQNRSGGKTFVKRNQESEDTKGKSDAIIQQGINNQKTQIIIQRGAASKSNQQGPITQEGPKSDKSGSITQEGIKSKSYQAKQEGADQRGKAEVFSGNKESQREQSDPDQNPAENPHVHSANYQKKVNVYRSMSAGPVQSPNATAGSDAAVAKEDPALKEQNEIEVVAKLINFTMDNIKTEKEPPILSATPHTKLCVVTVKTGQLEGLMIITVENDEPDGLDTISKELRDLIGVQAKILGRSVEVSAPTVMEHTIVATDLLDIPEIQVIGTATTRHGQVSISFLKKDDVWAVLKRLKREKMTVIKPEQVPTDVPLDFNLYLYLEKNKRFFKIINKDGHLSQERKERLIIGKQNVYIESDEEPGLQDTINKDTVKKTIKK